MVFYASLLRIAGAVEVALVSYITSTVTEPKLMHFGPQ